MFEIAIPLALAVQPAEHYEATMACVNQDQVNPDLLAFLRR